MRIAIVQLARLGDIIHILPVAHELYRRGHEVHFFTSGDFSSILEAVGYVTVHPMAIGYRDVAGVAALVAAQGGFDQILLTQVDGNEKRPPVECENFTLQQWARAGAEWLTEYHNLPLVFDKRDHEAEAKVIARYMPGDSDTPILAYNLHSHSSPFIHFGEFETWLRQTFGQKYRLIDIGPTAAPCARPHHLVGLIEKATVLVTVDTATLHLGYATNTPTVALSAGKTPGGQPSRWYDSEPRSHWICKVTYDEARTDAGRKAIAEALREPRRGKPVMVRPAVEGIRDRVWHVFDYYLGNIDDNRRILAAHKTRDWHNVHDRDYRMRYHELTPEQRSSRDVGDSRRLPYIKDIIDYGCADPDALDADVVLFTNSDVCLCREAVDEIRKKLATVPCCFSRRVDVSRAEVQLSLSDLADRGAHVGADLFAFRIGWWKQHRNEMPDLFLSCEGWDAIARWWMRKYSAAAELIPPVIWHEVHESYWAKPLVIHDNPGQRWNRQQCEQWVRANGCEAALFGDTNKFLFKSDSEWMETEK